MYGHGWWNSHRDQSGLNHIFLNYTRYYVFENLATYTRDAMVNEGFTIAIRDRLAYGHLLDGIGISGINCIHEGRVTSTFWFLATYTRDTIYFFTQGYYNKSFCVYGDCWISRYASEGGGINAHHIRFKLDHTEDFYVTATI